MSSLGVRALLSLEPFVVRTKSLCAVRLLACAMEWLYDHRPIEDDPLLCARGPVDELLCVSGRLSSLDWVQKDIRTWAWLSEIEIACGNAVCADIRRSLSGRQPGSPATQDDRRCDDASPGAFVARCADTLCQARSECVRPVAQ